VCLSEASIHRESIEGLTNFWLLNADLQISETHKDNVKTANYRHVFCIEYVVAKSFQLHDHWLWLVVYLRNLAVWVCCLPKEYTTIIHSVSKTTLTRHAITLTFVNQLR